MLVLELEQPLTVLLEKLRPDILEGNYKIVIGEQVSGHVPALILGHAIKLIYRAQKLDPPIQGFIAGSRDQRYEAGERKTRLITPYITELREKVAPDTAWELLKPTPLSHIARFFKKKKAKALVISETIHTGVSITPILEAFRRNHIRPDIAMLYFDNQDEMSVQDLERELQAHVVDAAAFPNQGENFFLYRELTGLTKNPEELFAQSMSLTPEQIVQKREVRRIASEIAKRIARTFLEGKA